MQNAKSVKVVEHVAETCDACALQGYTTKDCSTLSKFKEVRSKQANAFNAFPQQGNNLYSDTDNENYPNLIWMQKPTAAPKQQYAPPKINNFNMHPTGNRYVPTAIDAELNG